MEDENLFVGFGVLKLLSNKREKKISNQIMTSPARIIGPARWVVQPPFQREKLTFFFLSFLFFLRPNIKSDFRDRMKANFVPLRLCC
jgi:hypothetical protein